MSELRYRVLFDLANDCLMILDMNGIIRDINRTGHELLDKTEKNGFAIFESAHRRKKGLRMPVKINTRIINMDGFKQINDEY